MECLKCGFSGEFIGKSLKCPHCCNLNAISVPAEHFRICYCCFRIDKVSTKGKARAEFCRSCSSRIRNKKAIKDLVRYRYNCEGCGKERVLKAKSDAKLCKTCSFEASKKGKKYSRTCKSCNATETVRTLPASKNPLCTKCQKDKRNAERYRGTGTGKKAKKAKKVYTQIGTDGAKRNKVTVKFQVVDLDTMEAPVKKREPKEFPQLDEAVSLQMQNDWLKNNSAKVG